jgi:hypothetical protein
MLSRAPLRSVLITLSLAGLVWLIPAAAPAGMRHAGSVLIVDAAAPIQAKDLKIGDFVVVELMGTAPENAASLVMVTHHASGGS